MKRLLILALIAAGGWHYWTRHAANETVMVAPDDPEQVDLVDASPFDYNGYQITPLADFRVKARVLSTASYKEGHESEVSPVDFALGWGPMSVGKVIHALDISQADRRFYWRWQDAPPIPEHDIITHASNMHMIPADDAVAKQLRHVSTDDLVELDGQLVYLKGRDWEWRSSTSREDTGDGACEVVLVRSIQVH